MVKTWVLVGLLLAFLIASGSSPVSQTQAGSAAHWTGEVTLVVRNTEGSDSVGEWAETYQLHVDWKEAHRILSFPHTSETTAAGSLVNRGEVPWLQF